MSDPKITVQKFGYSMPVSCCVMTDNTGVNHCEHPPPPQPTRRQRIRWAVQDWWLQNKPHIHRGPCETEGDW